MNRISSIRRAKQLAYYQNQKFIHPKKASEIRLYEHPKFGKYEQRESLEHLAYMKQKVWIENSLFDKKNF